MKIHLLKWPLMLLMSAAMITACSDNDDDDDNNNGNDPQTQSIAATAEANAQFSILVDALNRTQLYTVLDDASASLTVFAPTDAAFGNLLNELGYSDLDDLEGDLGTAGLRNVLLYHVLEAKVMSSQVTTGYVTTQAENDRGNNLSAFINTASGVRLNGKALVTTTDIEASNGVIHEVNKVMMPESIFGLISANSNFSSLTSAAALADGNVDQTLRDDQAEFTLFAPNEAAFQAAMNATGSADLNELVNNIGGTAQLANILMFHLLTTEVQSGDVSDGTVNTALNQTIDISTTNGVELTDGQNNVSSVVATDITATNGVIHEIDGVLLP